MRTDLRLLLDECLQHELADEIKKWSAVDAKWVNDPDTPPPPSTKDKALMAVACSTNRILVTVEGRINEKTFRICTHPGIIVFRAKRQHEAVKAKIFRLFMLSGYRSDANKAVTYLKLDGLTLNVLDEHGQLAENSFRWGEIRTRPRSKITNSCKYPERAS